LEATICHEEIRLRMSKAWNKWRLAGVLCDKIMPTKLKILTYNTAMKPVPLYSNRA